MTIRSWFAKWFRSRKQRSLMKEGRSGRKRVIRPCVEPLEDRTVPAFLTPTQVAQAYGINEITFGGNGGSGATANITGVSSGAITAVTLGAGGSGYPDSSSIELSVTGGSGVNGIIEATTNASGVVTAVAAAPVQAGSGYSTTTGAATAPAGLGAGQTIAIIDEGDDAALVNTGSASFNTSDLFYFDHNLASLPDPPSFTVVGEMGTSASRPTYPSGGNPVSTTETTLDVEWAHAIAPGANIVLIECVNGLDDSDIGTAIETGIPAVDTSLEAQGINPVSVVSMSFGGEEYSSETGTAATISAGITQATEASNTVTITWADAGFALAGNSITISGFTNTSAGYNGTFQIASANSTSFTYTDGTSGLPTVSGSGTAALPDNNDGSFAGAGVSFVASTGDNGVPPSYASLSPNVLGVGATNLFLNTNGSYQSETAWSNPATITNSSGTTGGTITITTATESGVAVGASVELENAAESQSHAYKVASVLSGTQFTYADTNNVAASTWNGGTVGLVETNGGGSDGGVSEYEPQPSYQQGPITQAAISQSISASPSGATESGTTVTIKTTTAPNLLVGSLVTIAGVSGFYGPDYDGTYQVVSENSTSFTYTSDFTGLGNSGGGTATQGPFTQIAVGQSISSASESSQTVTITTTTEPNCLAGNAITISGFSGAFAGYNGTFAVASVNIATNSFTYTDSISGLGASSGGTAALVSDSRTNPDVSIIGGNLSAVMLYDSGGVGGSFSSNNEFGADGTSLSAPCWAGLIAIADQGLAMKGQPLLQSSTVNGATLQTVLYDLPSTDYHDNINDGYNGYPAENGYNLLTGLGSPVANTLVPDLANAVIYIAPSNGTTQSIVVQQSGSTIDVTDNSTLVASGPVSTTSQIDISGGAGTGTIGLTVNYTGGVFNTIPINFNGGTGGGSHSLTITGATLTSLTYDATGVNAGDFVVNGASADKITFTNAATVTDSATVGSLTLNVDPGNAISGQVNATFTASGSTTLQTLGDSMASLTFANPTGALTVNGHSAANDIAINSLGTSFNAALTLNGGSSTGDAVGLNTNVALGSSLSTGNLNITAAKIDLDDSTITTNNGGANGTVTMTGAVTLGYRTGLLVPAYFDPTADPTDWASLDTAALTTPVIAIMNPSSGPGSSVNPAYTTVISALQANGGQVIGYVPTGDGADSLASVETEINEYHSFYPAINGIFLDQMTNGTESMRRRISRITRRFTSTSRPCKRTGSWWAIRAATRSRPTPSCRWPTSSWNTRTTRRRSPTTRTRRPHSRRVSQPASSAISSTTSRPPAPCRRTWGWLPAGTTPGFT